MNTKTKQTIIKLFNISVITIIVVFALISTVKAQDKKSWIGLGAAFNRTTNYDPSPAETKDGGYNFGSIYVEAGSPLPLNLEMRLLAEYGFQANYKTIFTRDEGATREAIGEIRLRPSLRFYFTKNGFFTPFVSGGIDYYKQRFKEVESLPAYEEHNLLQYEEMRKPSSGLNPTFTVGTGIAEYHEASFTRLFKDTTILNASELEGYRVNYDYTRPLNDRFSLKVGGEFDYVTFQEASGFGLHDRDYYREKDAVFKIRAGLILK